MIVQTQEDLTSVHVDLVTLWVLMEGAVKVSEPLSHFHKRHIKINSAAC